MKSRKVEKIELLNDLTITFSPSSLDDAYHLDPPLSIKKQSFFRFYFIVMGKYRC